MEEVACPPPRVHATTVTAPEGTTFKRKSNGLAEDLGAVIGFSNTLLLCGTRGGKTMYIPESANPGHLLARLLGDTAFRRLVEEWGGETLTIPSLADFGRWRRIRKAAELRVAGRSLHSIALMTGVTYQQVKNDIRSAEMLGLLSARRLARSDRVTGNLDDSVQQETRP